MDPANAELAFLFEGHRADGAYDNGTEITKIRADEGDVNAVGSKGIVRGSMYISEKVHQDFERAMGYIPEPRPDFMYFIEWEDYPGMLGACLSHKVIS